MDTRYLTTFQVIVKEGSFARAAERLHYTQSAITFHVAQLEQELALPLFEKVGRRMLLTKAGQRLLPYVEDILSSVERLHSFEQDRETDSSEVSIGVAETQLCYRLGPLLGELHRRAPRAQLRIRSMNCYDIRDSLASGDLDLGVFYAEVGGLGSNHVTHSMGNFPLVLVASPEIASQFSDFSTPDRQLEVPFLINEPNCIFRQIFERYLNEHALRVQQTIELGSIPTIINLVRSGLGITFLPRFAVDNELAQRTLVEIPIRVERPSISALAAHHRNKWLSPAMQEFIELAQNSAVVDA